MAKTTNLLAAFLGGAAAGALVGILLAPDAGVETRRKIVRAKDRSLDYIDDLVEDGKQTWNDTKGRVIDSAGVAASDVDEFVRHILDRGQRWWKRAKNKSEDLADQAKDAVDKGERKVRQYGNKATDEAERMGDRVTSEAKNAANSVKEKLS